MNNTFGEPAQVPADEFDVIPVFVPDNEDIATLWTDIGGSD